MKIKHALIIFSIGFLISIFGAFLKITHLNIGPFTGNVAFAISSMLEITGILLLLYKLFTSQKFRDFLNW